MYCVAFVWVGLHAMHVCTYAVLLFYCPRGYSLCILFTCVCVCVCVHLKTAHTYIAMFLVVTKVAITFVISSGETNYILYSIDNGSGYCAITSSTLACMYILQRTFLLVFNLTYNLNYISRRKKTERKHYIPIYIYVYLYMFIYIN